MMDAGLKVTAA